MTGNGNGGPRIGVYVCHCGSNIAGTVDVAAVARWAGESLPHVAVARDYRFMCSSLGQELIQEDIRKEGLDRVVVAACSPHLHERTFRRACAGAGLNGYLCQMANIREHVSWATEDKAAATDKAKAVLSGAVHRVAHHEALDPTPVAVNPATLVVGGGIAGIQAALELADGGRPVYLVEREPSIGGHMAQFDKTFPTLDCAACILTPRMSEVAQHENVTLMSYAEVEQVTGSIGGFHVRVRQKARCVVEAKCTGCGVCIEKCPQSVVDDVYEAGLGYRKAIYRPFPQAVPKYPVIDKAACTYFQRGKCKACQLFCSPQAIDFDQKDEILDLEVGNIILATGYELFDCRRLAQYGYGRLANVFTNLEFERLCNAAGPTNGKIVLRDGVTEPKSVALVHCVGSRDRNTNRYCSAVCCMSALKFGHLLLEKTGAQVTSFYIDMRTLHKGYEEFYDRLLDEGMHFVRGRVAEVTDAAREPGEEGKLIVQYEDTLIGKQRRMPVDMVILMAAIEPRPDARQTALRFGLSCSQDGWFIERHPKLDPVATMTDGIFIAGTCQGPKDIPDSVAQGAAAAARVAGMISRGTVWIEPVVAKVEAERCSGCRICNTMCPFNAISFDAQEMVSVINVALCKGCGTCVAACPAGAISGAHFNDRQIEAEIDGVLYDAQPAPTIPVAASAHEEVLEMTGDGFEPKIVGFVCNWCSYRAADLAGTARMKHAPNVRFVRTMCSGRVDPSFVLRAFAKGADGVMITGCHPGECHYLVQNYKTIRRFAMLRRTLRTLGIEDARLRLQWASAAEGAQLAAAIDHMVAEVRALGPLDWPRQWAEASAEASAPPPEMRP